MTLLTYALFTFTAIGTFNASPPAAYKSVGCDFFGPDNAAKLLGPAFRGEDAGMKETEELKSWGCTFLRTQDPSERSPKIHFSLKKSVSIESATKAFAGTRESNDKKLGWYEWPGVGDEAIVHSDAPNFHLIMIRKGVKTISVKVNPADGIALSDVKDIMAKLATRL